MNDIAELVLWRQLVVLVPLGVVLVAAAVLDATSFVGSLKKEGEASARGGGELEAGTGRIPNGLTYGSIVLGLVAHTIAMGWSGLGAGVLAVVLTFAVGIFVAASGLMGGGDVKLLMGVGAFLGLDGEGAVFFYGVLSGAVLGLVMSLFNGYLLDLLKNLFRFIRGMVLMVVYRTANVRQDVQTDPRGKLPFAVPLLVGGGLAYSEAVTGWPGVVGWIASVVTPLSG